MPQFRFILGRDKEGASVAITNPDFATDLAGWTNSFPIFGYPLAGDWVWNAGVAEIGDFVIPADSPSILHQDVLELGKWYKISYDLANFSAGGGGYATIMIGDVMGATDTHISPVAKTFTHIRRAVYGTNLGIFAQQASIDNIAAVEMDWNDPIIDQPINWDKASINIERDSEINGLTFEYIANLEFHGDGYDFILNKYETEGVCSEIPILIEQKCSDTGSYERLFEGIIYLSDCEFDLKKCQVKCDIENVGINRLVKKSKNTQIAYPFTLEFGADGYGIQFAFNLVEDIDFHTAAGLRVTAGGIKLDSAFGHAIIIATQGLVKYESDFFGSGGAFENLVVASWASLLAGQYGRPIGFSFNSLFMDSDSIFALSFQSIIDSSNNNLPIIKVEPLINLRGITSVLTLNNIINPEFKFDTDALTKTVSLGYKKILNNESEKGTQYLSDANCADGDRNIVSNFIQQTAIITGIIAATVTDTRLRGGDNIYIVECEPGAGPPDLQSIIYPGNSYNNLIEADDNASRWVEILGGSLVRLDDTQTIIPKTNDILIRLWKIKHPITKSQLDDIREDTNKQITFNSPQYNISDLNGNILNIKYDVIDGLTTFELLTE